MKYHKRKKPPQVQELPWILRGLKRRPCHINLGPKARTKREAYIAAYSAIVIPVSIGTPLWEVVRDTIS